MQNFDQRICFKMYDDSWCIAAGSSISGLVMHQFVRCWTQMFGNMKRCLDIGHNTLCPVTALLLVSIFTLVRLAISTLHPSLEMIMLILTFNYNTNLENASLKLLIWLSVSCGSSIVFLFLLPDSEADLEGLGPGDWIVIIIRPVDQPDSDPDRSSETTVTSS